MSSQDFAALLQPTCGPADDSGMSQAASRFAACAIGLPRQQRVINSPPLPARSAQQVGRQQGQGKSLPTASVIMAAAHSRGCFQASSHHQMAKHSDQLMPVTELCSIGMSQEGWPLGAISLPAATLARAGGGWQVLHRMVCPYLCYPTSVPHQG